MPPSAAICARRRPSGPHPWRPVGGLTLAHFGTEGAQLAIKRSFSVRTERRMHCALYSLQAGREVDLGVLQRLLKTGNSGRVALTALRGSNLARAVASSRAMARRLDKKSVVLDEQSLAIFDVVRLSRCCAPQRNRQSRHQERPQRGAQQGRCRDCKCARHGGALPCFSPISPSSK